MLSSLARGYGSWTGDIDLCQSKEHINDSFPVVGYPDPHRHGITVTPRGHPSTPATAASSQRIRFENADGRVDIPKTFLTRKGALLLFTAPDEAESVELSGQRVVPRHHKGKKLLDLSLKLGTLDRLCKSVLQYGDEEYDRENSSVTDPRNKLYLKFTKQTSDLDDGEFDAHSQPGAELGFYLRDLKSRASSRIYGSADPRSLSRSPELREILRDLDGALPRTKRSVTCADFTESPRGSPKQRVLSSKKLTASLKSSTYLGRPASAVSTSTTTVTESVGNLPRIPSESSGRSRSSTKSGLWVQGYDLPSKSEDRRSSKSSAKSRSSKSSGKSRSSKSSTKSKPGLHDAILSEKDQTTKHVIPASQTEDDITSAADEQEILLPSDAEDEDGFEEEDKDQWPVTEVITTEVSYREGSPVGDDKDVQSLTQPLMPQYTATDMEESGDLDVPVQEEEELVLDDTQEAEPVMQAETGEGEKRDDALMTPVPYVGKETTETDTSGGLTPEAEQLLDKDIDQMSVATGEEDARETSSDAGDLTQTPAGESQTLTEAGEPSAGDSAEGTGVPDVEDKQGDEEGKVSPEGTAETDVDKDVVSPDLSVKEKGKVTFNEKVSMQTVPKTSVLTKKQPQPPKTKAPSKPAPKQRVVKGGNQKGGKAENKTYVKALDISSVQPDEVVAEEQPVTEEEPPVPEKKARQKLPPARHVETKSDKTKSSVLPSHLEEVLHRRSASKSQEELENEMAQMSEALEHTLAGPTLAVDFDEGLTAEELTLAQEALLERVKEAESKIDSVAKKKTPQKAAAPMKKPVDPKSRKKKAVEEKRDLQKERAAIREQRKREKQQRLEEAMALQEKIKAREAKRKAEEEEARRKAEELAEEIAALKREEEEIQQAEEDARHQLALARKKEREAREQRRREDLERRKQEAIRRREKEKQMMEAARQKEEEMLKRIADNEMKRQLQEEEARKREEEETMAQEKYEEELREAQKEAEEDEQRMRELEKEAEEEAMQRLVDEREEAERRRWKLKELARQMKEEEEKKRQLMLEEEQRLEEERKQKELEEQQKLMEERIRLMELQRMEAEARETMRHELERRREWAQRRREMNLERRENLDNVRHGQGITRPWVFSYFPDWPLDSYNKLMGADAKKNLGFRPKPKPKPPPENPAEKPRETTEELPPDSDLAL